MFVPVRHGERTAGILSIQSYTPRAYTRSDLAILQALADHCGGALERLRVEEALRESQAQLGRTEEFSLVMTAHLGLDGRWLKVPPTLCRVSGLLGDGALALRERGREPSRRHRARPAAAGALIQGEARSYDLEKRYLRRRRHVGLDLPQRLDRAGRGRQAALLPGLPARHHRAEEPGGPASPGAEDGGGGPARRRRSRTTSTTSSPRSSATPSCCSREIELARTRGGWTCRDQPGGAPGGDAHPPAARVQPEAGPPAQDRESEQRGDRSLGHAAPDHRRGHRAAAGAASPSWGRSWPIRASWSR